MARKPSKSTRLKMIDGEPDRISYLLGDVIDKILSHLPIREAVRTSVLSNKWRYKWATIPNLVFDKQCVSATSKCSELFLDMEGKLMEIIDQVLLLYSGPINKFQISRCGVNLISETALDRWIFHLTKRSIKELVLQISERKLYKIPWCLFSCQSLHHLTLYYCLLKPPSTIEGLKNLKSLDLDHVSMSQYAFENLISSCPLLENLTLTELDGFTQINIHAPNLKVLDICGKFEDISFDNTFQLDYVFVDLSLYLNSESNQSRLHGSPSNLLNFFAHLHHIHGLVINGYFLKYLAAGAVPVKLPTPCINLTYLWFSINFYDFKEISTALCVFRSSPNLKELNIFAKHEKKTIVLAPAFFCWEDIFLEPSMLTRVRHVGIEGISGIKSELDFMRFLLLHSPVLEKMRVKPNFNVGSKLMSELLRFKRASAQAEVVYLGEVYW
ncbi:F-box/FBD/LRR-repeat protein At1g13570 isoform X1 [Medicago truncatula]|uniref:F-box/FBD/LRR-repeat protein At1g13570 isoform X1 n=1 Tax=Medicago truncatula TaxID=3880 RepID=UPI0000F6F901|nr:F-box/FBD/LRR-repeat protein At1g13570 isoform X1 [Medicago truncatula]